MDETTRMTNHKCVITHMNAFSRPELNEDLLTYH